MFAVPRSPLAFLFWRHRFSNWRSIVPARGVSACVRLRCDKRKSWPRSQVPSPNSRTPMTLRNGLASLLRPEDSVLVLIDHQPFQLTNLNSHDPQMVINNTAGLAKAAKVFGVPTILTSVIAERGGLLFRQITEVFPGQEVI